MSGMPTHHEPCGLPSVQYRTVESYELSSQDSTVRYYNRRVYRTVHLMDVISHVALPNACPQAPLPFLSQFYTADAPATWATLARRISERPCLRSCLRAVPPVMDILGDCCHRTPHPPAPSGSTSAAIPRTCGGCRRLAFAPSCPRVTCRRVHGYDCGATTDPSGSGQLGSVGQRYRLRGVVP